MCRAGKCNKYSLIFHFFASSFSYVATMLRQCNGVIVPRLGRFHISTPAFNLPGLKISSFKQRDRGNQLIPFWHRRNNNVSLWEKGADVTDAATSPLKVTSDVAAYFLSR